MENFACFEAPRCYLTFQERQEDHDASSDTLPQSPPLRLSCNRNGQLFWTKNRKSWEEWLVIAVDPKHHSMGEEQEIAKSPLKVATATTTTAATTNAAAASSTTPHKRSPLNRAQSISTLSPTPIPQRIISRPPPPSSLSPSSSSRAFSESDLSPKPYKMSMSASRLWPSPPAKSSSLERSSSLLSQIRLPTLEGGETTKRSASVQNGTSSGRSTSANSTTRHVILQSVLHGFQLYSLPDGTVQVLKPSNELLLQKAREQKKRKETSLAQEIDSYTDENNSRDIAAEEELSRIAIYEHKCYNHWRLEFNKLGTVVFSAPAHGGRRLRVSDVTQQLIQHKQQNPDFWTSLQTGSALKTKGKETTPLKKIKSVPILSTVPSEDVDPEDDHWWDMEFLSGELCSVSSSHTTLDRQMQSNTLSGLHVNHKKSASDGSQIFRFIPVQNQDCYQYMITTWSHPDQYLTSDATGRVFLGQRSFSAVPSADDHCQRWVVQPAPDEENVWIESLTHGQLLAIQPLSTSRQSMPTITWQGSFTDLSSSFLAKLPRQTTTATTAAANPEPDMDVSPLSSPSNGETAPLKSKQAFRFPQISWSKGSDDPKVGDSASTSSTSTTPDDFMVAGKKLTLHMISKEDQDEDCCKWDIRPAHSYAYYLTCGRRQISSDPHGKVQTSKNFQSWEQWKVCAVELTNDSSKSIVTLQSVKHESFLAGTKAGALATTCQVGPWSYWEIVDLPGGVTRLICASTGLHLVCTERGELTTIELEQTDDENPNWKLVPCLPGTITGSQMTTMAAVGVAGVALSVAMPLAVFGVAEAVAAAEIAAVGVVSSEALAAVAGGGALMGAGVLAGTQINAHRQHQRRMRDQLAGISVSGQATIRKPVSAWRYW